VNNIQQQKRTINGISAIELNLKPIADVQHAVVELKAIYNYPNHVKLIAYEGVEHEVLPEMIDRINDWFEIYLKDI